MGSCGVVDAAATGAVRVVAVLVLTAVAISIISNMGLDPLYGHEMA